MSKTLGGDAPPAERPEPMPHKVSVRFSKGAFECDLHEFPAHIREACMLNSLASVVRNAFRTDADRQTLHVLPEAVREAMLLDGFTQKVNDKMAGGLKDGFADGIEVANAVYAQLLSGVWSQTKSGNTERAPRQSFDPVTEFVKSQALAFAQRDIESGRFVVDGRKVYKATKENLAAQAKKYLAWDKWVADIRGRYVPPAEFELPTEDLPT